MVWLADGEKKLKISLFVSTEFTNVTDGHTDIQIPHDGIGLACIAMRGKNASISQSAESRIVNNIQLK